MSATPANGSAITETTTFPTDRPRTGAAHPNWCDPEHCDDNAGLLDVHHGSTPIVWCSERDDVEMSLARYAYQGELAAGDDEPQYLLTLRHRALDENASVVLTNRDMVTLNHAWSRLVRKAPNA